MANLQLTKYPWKSRELAPRTPILSTVGPSMEKEPSPALEYFEILRRNKGKMLIFALAGILCGILFTLPQTPTYQAKITLEIQGLNENFLNSKNVDPTASEYSAESYIQTQLRILKSESLLQRVESKLHLTDRPHPSRMTELRKKLGLNTDYKMSAQGAIRMLADRLKVQAVGLTRIVEVSFDWSDPNQAAEFLNVLANEYSEQSTDTRFAVNQRTTEFLNKQLADLKVRLERSEGELQSYAAKNGLVIAAEKDNLAEDKLRQVQTEYSKAQAERAAKQAQYEQVKNSTPDSLPEVLNDVTLRDLKAKLNEYRRELAELNSSYTPEHYKVRKMKAQVAELEAAFAQGRENVVKRIYNEYQSAQTHENLLANQYSSQSRVVSGQAGQASHYAVLKSEVDSNRSLYDAMSQKVKEASIAAALRATNIRVVDQAQPPESPYKPNLPLNIAMGLLGGLALGIGLVVLRERTDRTIHVPGDVAQFVNVPELGLIPAAKSTPQLGMVTWEQKPSLVAESFRAALASILFSIDNGPTVMVISSAARSEGKSTVLSNLGIALAEIGRKVLLIDGDMRRPSLHSIFNLSQQPGLSECLSETTPIKAETLGPIVQETTVPNLYLLPSGQGNVEVVNLLYSSRIMELLNLFRQKFDVILIDTPPMLQIPDARVLGRISDGVILVVRLGRTTRDTVTAAVQRFTEDGTPVLGTILNGWQPGIISRAALKEAYAGSKDYYRQSN